MNSNFSWFNYLKFYSNFKLIKLFNFLFQKSVLGSVMSQLRGFFMYDTKQSMKDEAILQIKLNKYIDILH
jgi:hypothetical protein